MGRELAFICFKTYRFQARIKAVLNSSSCKYLKVNLTV